VTGFSFALIIDLLLLLLLGATLFVGWRLMTGLRHFRESKEEMEGLLNRLTAQIERAENGVRSLQIAAQSSGGQLEEILKDSKTLADELSLMNQSGNNLADRLEKLAEKNRIMMEQAHVNPSPAPSRVDKGFHRRAAHQDQNNDTDDLYFTDETAREFHIHDRAPDDHVDDHDVFYDDSPAQAPVFQSQAERDLYQALTHGKNRKGTLGRA